MDTSYPYKKQIAASQNFAQEYVKRFPKILVKFPENMLKYIEGILYTTIVYK